MVTDGAAIMVKLGRLAPCEHVICLSHTLHLVVTDVFYPKKKSDSDEESGDEEAEEADLPEIPELDAESEDELSSDLDPDAVLPNPATDGDPTSLAITIEPVIKKVRVIVKKFRRSPVKNDSLQKEVVKKYGKELNLIRDCKTRWSSLHSMIERFLKLESI